MFPCQLARPGLLFPGTRNLQLPPLRDTLFGFWILPLCSSCVHPPTLYSRLASCFCFLGRVFQALRMFRGFLCWFFWPSYQSVSDLFRSGAVSGLLVLRLLGFPVLSSPCGVSRLTKLSVPLCSKVSSGLDDFVLRPLRWCSAVSSCSLAFTGLADPFYFSSPSLSFLVCSCGCCSPNFPPSRL